MTSLTLEAPAKLNLGLAIVERRPDGFHELRTIFQAVNLHDTLVLAAPDTPRGAASTRLTASDPAIENSDNLVVRAVDLVRKTTGASDSVDITLQKTIPPASGLGGASGDAAATLLGLNRLWDLRLARAELTRLALDLGSDVPFFLSGGCAIARGRGEILRPLPAPPTMWYLIVVPELTVPIPRKTASLFAALEPSDLRDGAEIEAQAARLERGSLFDPSLLGNSFMGPLYRLRPELARLRETMIEAGAPFAAISGAGPAHYTGVQTREDAERISATLRSLYSGEAATFVVHGVPTGAEAVN